MIILHFHLQLQFKYELFHILHIKHHYCLSIQAFSIFGILITQLNCCEAGVKKYFLIYALAYAPPPPARLTPRH